MVGEQLVGLQDIIGGEGIEPGGDAETVVVFEGGASGGEQAVGRKRGQQRFDFIGAGVDQKSVGLAVFTDSVVAALVGGKSLQEICGDAGALQQSAVGPGGVAVHAAEQHVLMGVEADAEIGVENVGVRPELERQPENLKDVAAHTAAGFFGVGDEERKLVEGVDFLAGVGGDQVESAVDGVAVGIDEAGE